MRIFYKKRALEVDVKSVSILGKAIGLMFKRKSTDVLLFNFHAKAKRGIHSLFVFFPFIAVWLDDKNKVIEIRVVKPFTFSVVPSKKFVKLIEIPFNRENKRLAVFLVGKKETFKYTFD